MKIEYPVRVEVNEELDYCCIVDATGRELDTAEIAAALNANAIRAATKEEEAKLVCFTTGMVIIHLLQKVDIVILLQGQRSILNYLIF